MEMPVYRSLEFGLEISTRAVIVINTVIAQRPASRI